MNVPAFDDKRIHALIRAKEVFNLDWPDVAKASGVPVRTIDSWVKDGRKPQKWERVEHVLNSIKEKHGSAFGTSVPAVGNFSARRVNIYANRRVGDIISFIVVETVEIPIRESVNPIDGFVIDGGLEPAMPEGKRLLFERTHFESGDVVLADVESKHGSERVARVYKRIGSREMLVPMSSEYPMIDCKRATIHGPCIASLADEEDATVIRLYRTKLRLKPPSEIFS